MEKEQRKGQTKLTVWDVLRTNSGKEKPSGFGLTDEFDVDE